jgi:drug/metabolite transporter (DMT)-like permease
MPRALRSPAASARRDHAIGLVLVVVSACAFGSGALFAKPVYAAGLDWMALLAWRFLIAAAASWLWLLAFPAHRAALKQVSRRRILVLLVLGALYVGNSGTYFAALETVPASLAALIVYIFPALVAVLTLRYGRPLAGQRAWIALGLASLGVALAVGGIAPGSMPPILGLVLTLASPIIYAVWIILAARLGGERSEEERIALQDAETSMHPETTDAAPATAIMTTATFAVFWVAAMATGRPTTPADVPDAAWVGLIGVGLVSTALAMQTFYAGWRRIGAANASLVSTVEPVYTIVLATILFGEILTGVQILGGALVIIGVLLAQTGQRQGEAVAAPQRLELTDEPGGL